MKKWILRLRRGKFVKGILRTLFRIAGKLPVKEKSMVFESFLGKQYSDNPKALYLYLKEKYSDYQLYWSIDRKYVKQFSDENIEILPRLTWKWIKIMATSKYWIFNSRLPLWIPKRKETIYVQTWHGTPLKKLGVDIETVHMPGTDTEQYKENFTKEASKWDYLISPNRYSTEIFKRAFSFNKTVIESGYPRNDLLYNANEEDVLRIKQDLNIPIEKKIILYAPTWRDNNYYSVGKYKFDLELDLDRLQERFSDQAIILLRMHYLVAEQLDLDKYQGFAMDVSFYRDINELYLISDVLITDYSSVFFDYANLRKPILFFTYDIDDYRDNLRGFYFDIETNSPGPLLKTSEQVVDHLETIFEGEYTLPDAFEKFYQKFCYLEDGRASERVIKTIMNQNSP